MVGCLRDMSLNSKSKANNSVPAEVFAAASLRNACGLSFSVPAHISTGILCLLFIDHRCRIVDTTAAA